MLEKLSLWNASNIYLPFYLNSRKSLKIRIDFGRYMILNLNYKFKLQMLGKEARFAQSFRYTLCFFLDILELSFACAALTRFCRWFLFWFASLAAVQPRHAKLFRELISFWCTLRHTYMYCCLFTVEVWFNVNLLRLQYFSIKSSFRELKLSSILFVEYRGIKA